MLNITFQAEYGTNTAWAPPAMSNGSDVRHGAGAPLPGLRCGTVLCWVGSADAEDPIVPLARALAAQAQGQCHLVMGLDSPLQVGDRGSGDGVGLGGQAPLTPELIGKAERKLAELYGHELRTMVLPGHPIVEVRRYARRHGVELIVMGQQALETERRYGERLCDSAPCTVMILAPPKAQP